MQEDCQWIPCTTTIPSFINTVLGPLAFAFEGNYSHSIYIELHIHNILLNYKMHGFK